ncbi:MAG TPA: ABC transporter substrate-binding protein [Gaiellaceae bacterium]|nr:ABC transporter substrate-binding protein [Gaiellaceae bacterium]
MQREVDAVREIVEQYHDRKIDRREFFKRAGALGLSMSAASALVASPAYGRARGARLAGVTRGGTFIEGYDRDFTKMDTVQSGWADPGYNAIYEYVVIRDPKGRIVPAMAESWKVSADGLTWTFKIRRGLKFHSGAPCTAKEVVDNFNIFKNPKVGQNAIFWPPMTISQGPNNTVVIKLKKPDAALPETIATEYSMIENLATRAKLGQKYGAVGEDGTGPFTLAEFTPGARVRVRRWDGYPGSIIPFLQNHGKAYVDEVRWVPILEPANRANEIESGTVHAVKNPAGQDVSRLKGNSDLVVLEWPALANSFMSPNWQRSDLGFNDIRVRQAISHAIDREGIAKAVFFGNAVPTYGPIAPNYKYYNPAVEKFNHFDPNLSKKLLDQAGWVKGPGGIRVKRGKKLSFTHLDWAAQPQGKLIMEAIVPMLRDVGIEMKVKSLESAAFFPAYPKSDSFGYEWLWSSPVDVLVIFNVIPTPAYNGRLPDLTAAFKQWQTAKNEAQLKAAAYKAQFIWAQKLPKIPIVTRNDIWVYNKKVHGWRPTQTMLYPLYNDVWVER